MREKKGDAVESFEGKMANVSEKVESVAQISPGA